MFDIPPGFERFIPAWETLFLNLRRTPPEMLTAFVNAIGWALRALQAEKASYEVIERTLREAMRGLNGLSEEQFGQWLRVGTYLVLLAQHRLADPEGSPLFNLIIEEARQSKFSNREETQTMYTMANRLMDEGMAKGRAEGAQTSLRSAIRRTLAKRFGELPESITVRIEGVTALEELNALLDRALDAQSLADFTEN